MRKISSSSSDQTSQMESGSESPTLVRGRTGVSLIELCEAGRYREAQTIAAGMESTAQEDVLGLAMVEIARGNLSAAKDRLTPLALSAGALAERARVHLAHAYYLAGEINEARDLLSDVPDSFGKLLLKAIIDPRPSFALRSLEKCAHYDVRPGMTARLHNQRALIYRKAGKLDEAIQEYEAALYFFEQDHSDCVPLVLNNLARVYLEYGEVEQAHAQVDRAIGLLQDDLPHLGKALDEKSRILAAQGNFQAARIKSEQSVTVLRQSDRKEWLVEALLTYAQVLRSQGDDTEFAVLQEAADICRRLQRNDLLIDVLKRRHELSMFVSVRAEKEMLLTALDVCKGSYRGAAAKLGTTHWRLMRLVKKHGVDRVLQQKVIDQ